MPVIPVEEQPHDHTQHWQNADSHVAAADEGAPASNLPKPIAWLGKFHPPVTRFPIALFSAAGLVGATGFLGGALLYGLDHYAWWA